MTTTPILRIRDGVTRPEVTNLITNPGLHVDETGYTSSGSTLITVSNERAMFGKQSLYLYDASGTMNAYDDISGLDSAKTYTLSAYVYVPSTSDTDISLGLSNGGGFTGLTTVTTTTRDAWVRLQVSKSGQTSLRVQVTGSVGGATYWYVDGWQLEEGASATPYCDGNELDCYWSGTANASTSYCNGYEATVVNLLTEEGATGFYLSSWTPRVATYKGDGLKGDSPYEDGVNLVHKRFNVIQDTLNLYLRTPSSDEYARHMQILRRLLERASDYYVDPFERHPVYLEARAACETETRYAIVSQGAIVEDSNPFAQPFLNYNARVSEELALVIDHSHWSSERPRYGSQVDICNYGCEDINDYDQSRGVVVSTNAYKPDDITNLHIGTGSNLLGSSTPYALLGGLTSTYTYIGYAAAGYSKTSNFANVVFNLSIPQSGYTLVWEYYNGATWASISDIAGDTSLDKAGLNVVAFPCPSDWADTTPTSLVDGRWIRIRPSAVGTQNAYAEIDPYTASLPYFDVSMDNAGDIGRKLKYDLTSIISTDQIYVCPRSLSRGENFVPYINIADEQVPTGISIALSSGTSYTTYYLSPVNSAATHSWAPPLFPAAGITISAPLAQEYVGKFHLFAFTNSAYDWWHRLRIYLNDTTVNAIFDKTVLYDGGTQNYSYFGIVNIDPSRFNASLEKITIYLSSDNVNDNNGETVYYMYVVMLPADESPFLLANPGYTTVTAGQVRKADSITEPKANVITHTLEAGDSDIDHSPRFSGPSELRLNKRRGDYRVWLYAPLEDDTASGFGHVGAEVVRLYGSSLFLNMRGNE